MRITRPTFSTNLLSLLLTLISGFTLAAEPVDVRDLIKQTFKVEPGGTVHINLDSGDIDLTTHPGHELLIEIELRIDAETQAQAKSILENYHPEFEQQGNDVFVRSVIKTAESFWNRGREDRIQVRLKATVPKRYNVVFNCIASTVHISDLDGFVQGHASFGAIEIERTSGPLTLNIANGKIDVTGSEEHVQIIAAAANIFARDLSESFDIRTGQGDIEIWVTRQPHSNSSVESGAGSITVLLDRRVELDVKGVTSVGSADTNLPLLTTGGLFNKTVEGSLNGGGPRLQMRVNLGRLTIRKL